MSTRQEQNFLDPNIGTVALKIQEMVRDGWSLDEDRPVTLYGFMWEVWFERDATDAQIEKDAAEAAKPSRAEILAKARAAKAERKQSPEQPAEEAKDE